MGTMTLEQFLTQYKEGYDHDGAYGEQCTDWFRGYCKFVLDIDQPSGVDGAYQFWDRRNTDASLKNNFTPIANTPSAIPQYGDVIVWKKTLNGNFGHVAICVDRSANVNKFISSDQNWDGKSNASNKASTRPQLITHNYNHVVGFLRPKNQEKVLGSSEPVESDTMQIDEKTFEDLVNKSTKYDEFVDAGYADAEEMLDKISTLIDENNSLSNRLETLEKEKASLLNEIDDQKDDYEALQEASTKIQNDLEDKFTKAINEKEVENQLLRKEVEELKENTGTVVLDPTDMTLGDHLTAMWTIIWNHIKGVK